MIKAEKNAWRETLNRSLTTTILIGQFYTSSTPYITTGLTDIPIHVGRCKEIEPADSKAGERTRPADPGERHLEGGVTERKQRIQSHSESTSRRNRWNDKPSSSNDTRDTTLPTPVSSKSTACLYRNR